MHAESRGEGADEGLDHGGGGLNGGAENRIGPPPGLSEGPTTEGRTHSPATNGKASCFWKRQEDKYEMPLGAATFLRTEIERHLPLFEFRKGHRYTYITTVYFDTEKLEFFQRAKRYYDDNLKIRVKEYYYEQEGSRSLSIHPGSIHPGRVHSVMGRDGSSWLTFDCCFVEIKQRIRGLVVKRRFELPKRLLGRLLRGEDVWDELIASRSGIEFHEFQDTYREFRSFVQHYQVFPRSIINYRRSVFQQDEHQLRITFDDEIAVYEPRRGLYEETASLARSFLGEPREVFSYVIMEIKSQDGLPSWLTSLLRTHAPRRISKFTDSMKVLTQELPQLAGSGSLQDTHLQDNDGSEDTKQISDLEL